MKNIVAYLFFALLGMIALSNGQYCVSQNSCPDDTICTLELEYVCGNDGITYANSCIAGCWDTPVVSQNGCAGSGCVRG